MTSAACRRGVRGSSAAHQPLMRPSVLSTAVGRTAARKILMGGLRSCAEAVGVAADFPDVQGRGLDNSVAVVKLVDQNGPLRG
jgi:hypothetical protein